MTGDKGKLRAKAQRYMLNFANDEKQIGEEKRKRKEALERLVKISKRRKED